MLDFDGDDANSPVANDISRSLKKSERRSTMTGSAQKNEEDENMHSSQANASKRKLTIGNESISQFHKKQPVEEEVITEIDFDAGNKNLNDDKLVSEANNEIKGANASGLQQEGSVMEKGNPGDDQQSEASFQIMKVNSNVPPGFDDMSSQGGFIKKVQIDDMSSQGSYLRRGKAVDIDDQQSMESFMVKADSNIVNDKQLFNTNDDNQSDIILERGSMYESQLNNAEGSEIKKNEPIRQSQSAQIKPLEDEDEDDAFNDDFKLQRQNESLKDTV